MNGIIRARLVGLLVACALISIRPDLLGVLCAFVGQIAAAILWFVLFEETEDGNG